MIEHVRPDASTAPAPPRSTMIQRSRDFLKSEFRWIVNVTSWFFILLSGGLLVWVSLMMLVAPSEEIRLFSLSLDNTVIGPWGLTYLGIPGLVLALFQLSMVSTGAIFSMIPSRRLRRAGNIVLVSWALLWFGNLVSFAASGGDGATLSCMVMGVFASAIGVRAAFDWNRPGLRGRDLIPPYKERIDQLSDYAQNLFAVDDEAKESDRERRAREGAPWQRGVRRVRDLPWSRWTRQSTQAVKRGAAATGTLVSRGWRRIRDGRSKPNVTA